jgi:hypothetical protein
MQIIWPRIPEQRYHGNGYNYLSTSVTDIDYYIRSRFCVFEDKVLRVIMETKREVTGEWGAFSSRGTSHLLVRRIKEDEVDGTCTSTGGGGKMFKKNFLGK